MPPYVILHDKTLAAICSARPQSIDQLAEIPGIGERKLELYGDDLLQQIRQHETESTNSAPALDTV